MSVAMEKKLLTTRHKLSIAAEKLDTVSPLATLKRGYSITKDPQGKIVTHSDDVSTGDTLTTQLADGTITSVVQ